MNIYYKFHGVGQGLFCSGSVNGFHWIYDCGSFNEKLLKNSISQLSTDIDLLAISHFHEDHINGIPLLKENGIRIKKILIPYLSVEQRACVLIDLLNTPNTVLSNDLLQLIHSPGRYFNMADVIYILPSGEKSQNGNQYNLTDQFKTNIVPTNVSANDQWNIGNNIHYLNNGDILTCKDYFFIPFYDVSCLQKTLKKTNRDSIWEAIKNFFTNDLPESLQEFKDLIKRIRDKRSEICSYPEKYSMCLLGHPVESIHNPQRIIRGICNRICSVNQAHKWCPKFNVLYTGDAPLKAKCRLKKFLDFYKDYLNDICCFQVMHHGSRGNFKDGMAEQIKPCASIFSADPSERFHHPNKETMLEFFDYQPVLVNRKDFEVQI